MIINKKDKGIIILIALLGFIVYIFSSMIFGNKLVEFPIFIVFPIIFYFAYLYIKEGDRIVLKNFSGKLVGVFIIWASINLLLFIYSYILSYGYGREEYMSAQWYPFSWIGINFWPDESYDITELIIYTILPFALLHAYKLIRGNK